MTSPHIPPPPDPFGSPTPVGPNDHLTRAFLDAGLLPSVRGQDPQGPPKPPATYTPGAVTRQIEEEERQQEALFYNQLGASLRKLPAQRAEAQAIAAELGVDPNAVETNLDVLRELARRKELARLELGKVNPVLAEQLQDFEFAAVAHHAIENLSWLERIAGNWTAGQLEFQVGQLGAKLRDIGPLPEAELEYLKWARQQLMDLPSPNMEAGIAMSIAANTARFGGQMSYTLPRSIATGAVTATGSGLMASAAGPLSPITVPAAAGTGFFVGSVGQAMLDTAATEGGSLYLDLIDRGVNPERAARTSRFAGAVNGLIEGVAFRFAGGPTREYVRRMVGEAVVDALKRPTIGAAAKTFALQMLTEAGGETGEEVLQQLTTSLSTSHATGEAVDTAALLEELTDTAVATVQGTLLLAGAGPAQNYYAAMRQVKQAKATANFYNALAGNAAARADFIKQSPKKDRAVLEKMLRGTPNETTWVDLRAFLDVLKQTGTPLESLEPIIPGITEQVQSGVDDVQIPTAAIGSALAGSELEKALREHMRLDPSDSSAAEVAAMTPEEKKALRDEVEAALETERQWLNEAHEVQTMLEQQLVAAGRDIADARVEASLYRSFVEAQARASNVTPATYYALHPYTVGRAPAEAPTEAELQQRQQRDDAKWLDWEPPTTAAGEFRGAPEWVTSKRQLTAMRQKLAQFVEEGAAGRMWYENSARTVLAFVGDDVQLADKFIQLLAIYSPNTALWNNAVNAVRAFTHWRSGGKREDLDVAMGTHDKRAADVLYDGAQWEGRKTSSFYTNLMQEVIRLHPEASQRLGLTELADSDRATIDLWMYRAFGYENEAGADDKGTGRYSFAENEVRRLTARLNQNNTGPLWTPHQVQAAIWSSLKARYEIESVKDAANAKSLRQGLITHDERGLPVYARTPDKRRQHLSNWHEAAMRVSAEDARRAATAGSRSFADELMRMADIVTWEAIPSAALRHPINSASPEVQRAFTAEAAALLVGRDGRDELAHRLGVELAFPLESSGAYAGNVSPNVLAHLLPLHPLKKRGFSTSEVRAYARALQFIFRQDAVPWFRPENKALVSDAAREAQQFRVVDAKGRTLPGGRFDTQGEAEAFAAQKGGTVRGGELARAMVYQFPSALSPVDLRQVLQQLQAALGPDAGYTRTGPNEVTVVNFRDDNTKLPFARTDEQFIEALDTKFLPQLPAGVIAKRLWTQGEYGSTHDWTADSSGESILATLDRDGARRPDLLTWVRGRREAFDALLARYATRGRGAEPGAEPGTAAVEAPLRQEALPPELSLFSVLERQLSSARDRQTTKQWLSDLSAWRNKGVVKPAELDHTGFEEWLKAQDADATLTRDAVLEALRSRYRRVQRVSSSSPVENPPPTPPPGKTVEDLSRFEANAKRRYTALRNKLEAAVLQYRVAPLALSVPTIDWTQRGQTRLRYAPNVRGVDGQVRDITFHVQLVTTAPRIDSQSTTDIPLQVTMQDGRRALVTLPVNRLGERLTVEQTFEGIAFSGDELTAIAQAALDVGFVDSAPQLLERGGLRVLDDLLFYLSRGLFYLSRGPVTWHDRLLTLLGDVDGALRQYWARDWESHVVSAPPFPAAVAKLLRSAKKTLERIAAEGRQWEDYKNRRHEWERTQMAAPTRFDQYLLEEGTGYVETALTLPGPEVPGAEQALGIHAFVKPEANVNRLVHMRTEERHFASGGPDTRLLWVSEIQSDLQQKARDLGVELPRPIRNTEAVIALALNDIILQAVQGGYPRVAFINGDQSASLYPGASSVLRSIEWKAADPADLDGPRIVRFVSRSSFELKIDAQGVMHTAPTDERHRLLEGRPLSDLLGKELAAHVVKSVHGSGVEGYLDSATIETFGSRDISRTAISLRRHYDEVLPAVLTKILKRYGVQPELTQVWVGEPAVTSHGREEGRWSQQLSFQVTPAMKQAVLDAGGVPLFQRDEREGSAKRAPRAEFLRSKLQTLLREGADLSSYLHETGHYFLEVMLRSAQSPTAAPSVLRDTQTYLDWVGVKDLDAWRALSDAERAKHHEAFAYSFEIYLFHGQAPTRELQTLFDKFAAWLRAVYRGLVSNIQAIYRDAYGEDLPELSADIRNVMDRMLAGEDEMHRAEAMREHRVLFESPEQAGMTVDEWSRYHALEVARRDEAIAELTRDKLRHLAWMETARKGVLRDLQDGNAVEREDARLRIDPQVRAEPVYRAREWLQSGVLVDPDGNRAETKDDNHRLDRDAVRLLLGDDAAKIEQLAGVTREGGLGPDLVAAMFGFTDGRDLVNSLLDARPLDEEVQSRVDDQMRTEHPELVPGTTEHRYAVAAALQNEIAVRQTAVEMRALESLQRSPREVLAAARDVARARLGETAVRQLRPDRFDQAATRARKAAQDALAAGDHVGARAAKRRELSFQALARAARDAREEVRDALREFGRFARPDADLGKTRDTRVIDAARAILGSFGLGPARAAPLLWLQQVKEYAPALHDELAGLVAETTQRNSVQDYRDLSLAEFRSVRATVDALWHRSLRDRQVQTVEGTVALDTALRELGVALTALTPGRPVGTHEAPTKRAEFFRGISNTRSMLRRVEHWARAMDAGKPDGPFTRYLVRPLLNALTRYRADRTARVKRLVELVQKANLQPGTIAAPELNYTFGAGNRGNGRAELLGALLHSSSNRNKLLGGRGWTTLDAEGRPRVDADGTVDTSVWDGFVRAAIADGRLTKADFDFAQAVWDLLAEIKPLMQQAHYDLFGHYFEEVTVAPIVTPWGTYAGGYVPAKTDAFLVGDARVHALIDQLEGDFRQSMPSVPSGSTKQRVEAYRKPLALDIRRLVSHIDETIRFAHVQPVLRDVLSVLKTPSFRDQLAAVDPGAMDLMLLPWLNRAARQVSSEKHKLGWLNRFFDTLRARSGITALFGSLVNTAQNVFSVFPVMLRVKPRYLLRATVDLFTGSLGATVAEKSPFMLDRLKSQMREMTDVLNELVGQPSMLQRAQRLAMRHGYFLQRALQNVQDLVVWQASYQQALTELEGTDVDVEREAVQRADADVRQTQGSLNPEDISASEAGTPLMRLLTQFYGFFNNLANLNGTEYVTAWRRLGWTGGGRYAMIYLLGFAAPMIAAEALVRLAYRDFDEDDDGDTDTADLLSWFIGANVRGAAALVPGGSSLAVPINAFNGKGYDDRIMTSPGVMMLERALLGTAGALQRAVAGEEFRGRDLRDVVALVSLLTGLPLATAARPAGYAIDVERGAVSPSGPADFAAGLISGR